MFQNARRPAIFHTNLGKRDQAASHACPAVHGQPAPFCASLVGGFFFFLWCKSATWRPWMLWTPMCPLPPCPFKRAVSATAILAALRRAMGSPRSARLTQCGEMSAAATFLEHWRPPPNFAILPLQDPAPHTRYGDLGLNRKLILSYVDKMSRMTVKLPKYLLPCFSYL